MHERIVHSEDYPQVKQIIQEIFTNSSHGYHGEAELVEALRQEPAYQEELELVIENDEGDLVAHGLLSEVHVQKLEGESIGLGLAPLGVHPDYRNQGLGTRLFNALVQAAISQGYYFITIVGEVDFYGRFGYVPSNQYGITSSLPIPGDYVLIKEIQRDGLAGVSGVIHYPQAFQEVLPEQS